MSRTQSPSRFAVILAFGLVYLFWGSTYLAIDIAVQTIPPALMCGVRFSIAGVVMLAVCAATGTADLVFGAADCAGFGGGNSAADGRQPDAVVGGTFGAFGAGGADYRHHAVVVSGAGFAAAGPPSHFVARQSRAGAGDGGAGGVVLAGVALDLGDGAARVLGFVALLGGSFSWALGSVLSKRWQSGMDVFSATGWQVTAAGAANFLFALVVGDFSQVAWTARGVGAVLYLVVCGSWIGYTAYIWLLEHVPTSKVSTYAYVNPVVAVFLGWLILHERVDRFIVMGSVIVVVSVILVTSAKVKEKTVAEELPAVEAM